jgi:aldehyde:ferredoxin oxidoreductase
MVEHRGPSHRFLNVDLTGRSWSVYSVSRSDQNLFLGGKGLGLKIYCDIVGSGDLGAAEPLGPDNPLIFSLGPMLGTGASCTARFEVLTRSPLTRLMVGSSCGGPFGESCRTAGWDGVIIRGRAESPTLLRVHKDGAEFEDAAALWGLGTGEAQGCLNLGPKEAAALIGPAGENLVPYAVIRSGHRFAGRGGVGAVMGAKNLKAVIARGKDYRITPADADLFSRTVRKAKNHILRNDMLKGYRAYGTLSNVRHGIESGFVPVHNFRDRHHPDTEQLSGQAMAERYSTRHSSCRHCTVLCGHKGHYPDGVVRQIPEYETTGMFGSNIGNFNPDLIASWNDIMNELGLDTISTGGTIAWAMEAGEQGLRDTELRFGRTDNIASVLEDIAYRRGEGADLAEGTRALSRRYGGRDFAIQVKGLECAAYDPRSAWGHGLGYAVYNKGGCHLGSFLVGLERIMGYMLPHITIGKARWVAFMENLYAGVNSLQVCQFTIYGLLTEPPIPRILPRFVLKFATAVFPRLAISLMDWRVLSRYFHSATGIPMNKWEFPSGR